MKNIYLLAALLLVALTSASAQGIAAPWWGVHGGVSFSNLSSSEHSTDYLTGYSVGASYSHPLSRIVPIFLESGLYFQRSGARDHGFLTESGDDSSLVIHQLELPLLLGYHSALSSQWAIQSFVGLFYSFALRGRFRLGDDEFDPYDLEMLQTLRDGVSTDQQLLRRSNFGLRVGVSVLYNRWLLGFTYDGGLTNLYTSKLRDVGFEALSGSFTINAGFVF